MRQQSFAPLANFHPIGIDALPARVLYEDIFPAIVAEHCDPPIPYHRGSPYGGKGWDTADPTIGDVHQWNIWGGKEWPWQEYPFNGGRFIRYAYAVHMPLPPSCHARSPLPSPCHSLG